MPRPTRFVPGGMVFSRTRSWPPAARSFQQRCGLRGIRKGDAPVHASQADAPQAQQAETPGEFRYAAKLLRPRRLRAARLSAWPSLDIAQPCDCLAGDRHARCFDRRRAQRLLERNCSDWMNCWAGRILSACAVLSPLATGFPGVLQNHIYFTLMSSYTQK